MSCQQLLLNDLTVLNEFQVQLATSSCSREILVQYLAEPKFLTTCIGTQGMTTGLNRGFIHLMILKASSFAVLALLLLAQFHSRFC